MATILWGKPSITVTAVSGVAGASSRLTIPTPVVDSTSLSTERGDKHTADIEGGGFEAVRYDRGSFTLEFSVRFAKERFMPFSDVSKDGVVTGAYQFVIADPDDASAPTMTMHQATVSYEDEYNADDGARRHFYCDSIVPEDGSEQITWSDGAGASGSGQGN